MNSINSLFNLDNFLELMTDLVFVKNLEGKYTNCNQTFLDFIQKTRKEVIGKTDFDLFLELNAREFSNADKQILKSKEGKSFEEIFIFENGLKAYFNTTKNILYDDEGNQLGLFCVARNITKRKEYEIIYEDNQKLLELIAKENSLQKILDKIVYLAESRSINTKCSILILDDEGKRLLIGSSPNLPAFYNESTNGMKIGENIGSCEVQHIKKNVLLLKT